MDAIISLTSVTVQLEERKSKLDLDWSEYNAIQSQIEELNENEVNDCPGFEEVHYVIGKD